MPSLLWAGFHPPLFTHDSFRPSRFEQNDGVLELTTGDVNKSVYLREDVARAYAMEHDLHAWERAVLNRLKPDVAGFPILDIGVGGGRTTPAMLALSTDYLGIDYSGAMIAECRKQFPGVGFEVCDARNITHLGLGHFGFAWFSYNGIDNLSHADRHTVLQQVHAILRPGGYFFFSSHNILGAREYPWEVGHWPYEWNGGLSNLISSAGLMMRSIANYVRLSGYQEEHETHAIRLDSGHEYSCPQYYINPIDQVRILNSMGFVNVQAMGWSGVPNPPDSEAVRSAGHVIYLARKPS